MINLFKKAFLTAEEAHSYYLKLKPFSIPKSRGEQVKLNQILDTIAARAKSGHRVLWVKELSEDTKRRLQELNYKIIKAIDGDSYYIQW